MASIAAEMQMWTAPRIRTPAHSVRHPLVASSRGGGWWLGERVGSRGAQAVEDDRQVALPEVGRGVRQGARRVLRRAHQRHDICSGDVRAHRAVRTRALDQRMDVPEQPLLGPGQLRIEFGIEFCGTPSL